MDLTNREIEIVAPNVSERIYLLRPTPGFSTPPLCTLHELRTVYTLDDLADFHETLDWRLAAQQKAERELERSRETRSKRRR